MVLTHYVEPKVNFKTPLLGEVLVVILPVLPYTSSVRVSEYFSQAQDNLNFIVLRPVTFRSFDAEKRDTYGVSARPSKSDTSNLPTTSLDVNCDPSWPCSHKPHKCVE